MKIVRIVSGTLVLVVGMTIAAAASIENEGAGLLLFFLFFGITYLIMPFSDGL